MLSEGKEWGQKITTFGSMIMFLLISRHLSYAVRVFLTLISVFYPIGSAVRGIKLGKFC